MEQPATPVSTSDQARAQPLRYRDPNALPRRSRPSDDPVAKKARNDAYRAREKENRASLSEEELAGVKQDGRVSFTAPNLAAKKELMAMFHTIKASIGPSRSSQEGNFNVL
ncbi:Hypp1175 [Branchiostoma lanceolatum]|nr:Hypp1175 [Branchiostoma lanceolatum]